MTLALHFSSMVQVSATLKEAGHEVVFIQQVGCALLEHGRSSLATEAHDWGADVQLFVDDDVVVTNPGSVVGLVEAAMDDKLVVAPVLIGGGSRYNVTMLEPEPFKPPRLVRAGADCGMGCTAISRRCITEVVRYWNMQRVTFLDGGPKVWPLFRSFLDEKEWLGEDTSFAQRVGEAMGEGCIFADTRCQPQHWGMQPYEMRKVALV